MAQANPGFAPSVLIDGDGNFNDNIEGLLNLSSENGRVAVVSIMGAQSHGKSTLLNACFSTAFPVLDDSGGMHQTTKGIWIAKWIPPKDGPKILVIDMEGSDGSERGDDKTFEKKAALFALATSTTVIFNLKCEDINRHNGASLPLLRIVFEVMVRKFTNAHRVNLLFVLRDKTKTELGILQDQVKDGMRRLWNEMNCQSQAGDLTRYFDIQVIAMSHYIHQEEEFGRDAAALREMIISCSPQREIAARTFVQHAKTNWEQIKEDRILNLQQNKVMLDEAYCHQRAEEQYESFCENENWLGVKKDVESCADVQGFGEKVSSLLATYLIEYDKETDEYFDETARKKVRKTLTGRLLQVVEATYLSLVNQMRNKILANFDDAVMDELKETGALSAIKIEQFIAEFQNLLSDADIRQATGWNHASEHSSKLKSEIELKISVVHRLNGQLQEQRDKRKFWLKLATRGSAVAMSFAFCICQILLPGFEMVPFAAENVMPAEHPTDVCDALASLMGGP